MNINKIFFPWFWVSFSEKLWVLETIKQEGKFCWASIEKIIKKKRIRKRSRDDEKIEVNQSDRFDFFQRKRPKQEQRSDNREGGWCFRELGGWSKEGKSEAFWDFERKIELNWKYSSFLVPKKFMKEEGVILIKYDWKEVKGLKEISRREKLWRMEI